MRKFEWDKIKEQANIAKHGVSFTAASHVFDDPKYFVTEDTKHSTDEARWICFGMVDGKVMTVRFTYRDKKVRIIGAAYWRKGRKSYEKRVKN